MTTEQINPTDRTNKVLKIARQFADACGHKYVGTEHLLVAIERERNGVGAIVIREMINGGDTCEQRIMALIAAKSDRCAGSDVTPNELRATAERVARWCRRLIEENVHYDNHERAMAVAEAWLAEHPADDAELVTRDGIDALGIQKHGENNGSVGYYLGNYQLYVIIDGSRVDVCPPIGKALIVNPTWGQLRRLCAALGIQLKPTE